MRGKYRDTSEAGFYGSVMGQRLNHESDGLFYEFSSSAYELFVDFGQIFGFCQYSVGIVGLRCVGGFSFVSVQGRGSTRRGGCRRLIAVRLAAGAWTSGRAIRAKPSGMRCWPSFRDPASRIRWIPICAASSKSSGSTDQKVRGPVTRPSLSLGLRALPPAGLVALLERQLP